MYERNLAISTGRLRVFCREWGKLVTKRKERKCAKKEKKNSIVLDMVLYQ